MELLITFIFGLVSIISFAYAVWQNRKINSIKTLTSKIIARIKLNAETIFESTKGTTIEGYAKSISESCDELALSQSIPRIGQIVYKYPVFIPPMRTDCGEVVEDPD